VPILFSVTAFVLVGAGFIFINLTVGKLLRPRLPNPEKGSAYECGEPTIGPTWVQFDVRFYIIALVFMVFDVEVALFYPWAVVYGDAAALAARIGSTLYELRVAALIDMLVFFVILMTGFAYLWRFGFLDWVRTDRVEPTDAQIADGTPNASRV
jgi:NADH-quinone oxidoreductase subunit A